MCIRDSSQRELPQPGPRTNSAFGTRRGGRHQVQRTQLRRTLPARRCPGDIGVAFGLDWAT
eukprot:11552450-Alexandrium_andersonii.AAC.1